MLILTLKEFSFVRLIQHAKLLYRHFVQADGSFGTGEAQFDEFGVHALQIDKKPFAFVCSTHLFGVSTKLFRPASRSIA